MLNGELQSNRNPRKFLRWVLPMYLWTLLCMTSATFRIQGCRTCAILSRKPLLRSPPFPCNASTKRGCFSMLHASPTRETTHVQLIHQKRGLGSVSCIRGTMPMELPPFLIYCDKKIPESRVPLDPRASNSVRRHSFPKTDPLTGRRSHGLACPSF